MVLLINWVDGLVAFTAIYSSEQGPSSDVLLNQSQGVWSSGMILP